MRCRSQFLPRQHLQRISQVCLTSINRIEKDKKEKLKTNTQTNKQTNK